MEDSVTETEKLVVFASKEDARSVGGGKTKEEEEEPSGFINQLISNLVPAGSGKEEEEYHELEKKDHVESEGEKEDKEKEGGLFSHIISNLVPPSSTPKVKESAGDFGDDVSTSSTANGGGGMINNLISNIFHHSESRLGEEEKKHHEREQTEDTGGGGSIIEKIVSHLPKPLPGIYILPFSCLIHIYLISYI